MSQMFIPIVRDMYCMKQGWVTKKARKKASIDQKTNQGGTIETYKS